MSQKNCNEITKRIAQAIVSGQSTCDCFGKTAYDVMIDFLSSLHMDFDAYEDIDSYLNILMQNCKELDPKEIEENPYIKAVSFHEKKVGNFLLTYSSYECGEILQYDFPIQQGDTYIPRLGYYPKQVFFPTIYEGNVPWMSIIPSEINSMKQPIQKAEGKMLVCGLGLGYYAYQIGLRKEVSQITIVEKSKEVISLFQEYVLPQFESVVENKITILEADAYDVLVKLEDNVYDGVFVDLWEGQEDGCDWYKRCKPIEERLPNTKFQYWIVRYLHE